jgi:ComF family protein
MPVPLGKRRLKWRGFKQAEELAKELSSFLKIPLVSDCLIKIKETLPQVELSEKEREENIKGVFKIKNDEKILGKKILLVDDVYTTGSTMKECARILKRAGAKEIIGIVIARASPGQDQF